MLNSAKGTYRAVVVDNNDPLKANRVLMKVPQALGNATSMWAKPHSFYQYSPPVGSQVWATFDGGDIRLPIYSAPTTAPFGNGTTGQLLLKSPAPYGYPSTGTSSISLLSSSPGTTGSDSISLQATNTTVTGNLTVNGVGKVSFAYKNVDESVTSTAGLQNDDHLAITVDSNAKYIFDGFLQWIGDDTGDVKFGFNFPAGGTLYWGVIGPNDRDTAFASGATRGTGEWFAQNHQTASSASIAYSASTAILIGRLSGLLITAASSGTFVLRWAQSVSSTTATTLKEGSWLRVERVA